MARIIRAGSEEWVKLHSQRVEEELDLPKTPDELIKQALEESRSIKEYAAQEAQEARKAVLADAEKQGFAKGHREAVEAAAAVLESLRHLEKDMVDIKTAQLAKAEQDMVQLVLGIAEKILRRAVPEEKDLVTRVVRECVGVLKDRDGITISVHPDDADTVNEAMRSLKDDFSLGGECVIAADVNVEKGGARVRSRIGGAEGDVFGLLARIDASLRVSAGIDALPADVGSQPEEVDHD